MRNAYFLIKIGPGPGVILIFSINRMVPAPGPSLWPPGTLYLNFTDCYLRQGAHPAWQGASGTDFVRNGSRTCFLRLFYKRSQAYFGQKPAEQDLSIKKCCLEVKQK